MGRLAGSKLSGARNTLAASPALAAKAAVKAMRCFDAFNAAAAAAVAGLVKKGKLAVLAARPPGRFIAAKEGNVAADTSDVP